MTRTVTTTIYQFSELPEATQRKIINRWRDHDTFSWGDEWHDSLKGFTEAAPVRIRDWRVGYPGTHISFDMTGDYADEVGALSGVRAWKWLMNNGFADLAKGDCPFTGYCGDESLLDAVRTALANPGNITSLWDVFSECLWDWAKAYEADIDYWASDECIRDEIEANGYEFYECGRLV